MAEVAQRLRGWDYLLLCAGCLALFSTPILVGRGLSGHAAVIPQSAREMQAHHDWLVPTCGGYPWLERPPLSHWVFVALGSVVGGLQRDCIARLVPMLLSCGIVCLGAGMTARWFGRAHGLLCGFILATMWEFFGYAHNPEADILLCAVVTGAIALFVRLEFFGDPTAQDQKFSFVGRRPWPVLGLFVLLGLTNMAKGLLFGTLMAALPIAAFLLWNRELRAIRRYIWLWGWLVFAVLWLAWPLTVLQRFPDIVDLWHSDYVGRLNGGHIAAPRHYYLVVLPQVLLPWTVPALVGLWLTANSAFKQRGSAERLVWAWALVPPIVFSIPDGKHHHYLLQCLVPWAILASLGAMRLWQAIPSAPSWLRNPLLGALLFGGAADLAVWLLRAKIPGPAWIVPALLVFCPVYAFAVAWAATRRDGRLAAGSLFALVAAFYFLLWGYHTRYLNQYREEREFLHAVEARLDADRPLYVHFDTLHPLETFWLLYYSDDRAVLLHNATFLRDERIRHKEVYVLARGYERPELEQLGTAEVVLESHSARGLRSWDDRRTLFRVRFRDDLERCPVNVRVSPMQAVHRTPGPFLQ